MIESNGQTTNNIKLEPIQTCSNKTCFVTDSCSPKALEACGCSMMEELAVIILGIILGFILRGEFDKNERRGEVAGLELNNNNNNNKNQVSVGIRNHVFGTIFYKFH